MGLYLINKNMKFNFAAILLLATSAEATKVKSQAQMMAEIESMSMNTNMHQVSLREKTLLKTYLEVDMNEFLQQKVDSELMEGLDERAKAEFVGNFFHWVKCRFNDCNLLQTKSKINMKQASASPTAAEEKAIEDKKELDDWGKQGNVTPAYNDLAKHGSVVQYAQTSEANASQNKNKQKNTNKNTNTIKGKIETAGKTKSPTAAESKTRYDKLDLDDWGKQGNATSAFHHSDKAYVQTKADIKIEATRKQRLASDQFPAVQKELENEKKQELVKPTAPAENSKDTEPKWTRKQ